MALSGNAFKHFNSQLYIEGSAADELADNCQGEHILDAEAERLLGKDLAAALNVEEKV